MLSANPNGSSRAKDTQPSLFEETAPAVQPIPTPIAPTETGPRSGSAPLVIHTEAATIQRMVFEVEADRFTIQTGKAGIPQAVPSDTWLQTLHEAISIRKQ